MSYLHTQQAGYEPLRVDVTIGDTNYLDGVTSGRSLDFSDRPSYAVALTPNHNGVEIIAKGVAEAADGDNFSFRLWGYAANGPAEHIADISCTIGTAKVGGSSTALWVDTIVISSDTHIATCSVSDSANNRIAKLDFDAGGYTWFVADFTTQGAADLSQKVSLYYRPY